MQELREGKKQSLTPWTGRPQPRVTPRLARPTTTLWKSLSPAGAWPQAMGPWPVFPHLPGSCLSLLAAQRPRANPPMCAQPGSSQGYRSQSPGGERVEQALPRAPWVTLGRSIPSLGLSISIPDLAPTQGSASSCSMHWAPRRGVFGVSHTGSAA